MTTSERQRCAEIARRLDQGDMQLWKTAEPFLTREEKGLIWDLRRHVVARAERRRREAVPRRPARPTVEEEERPDIDDWPRPDDDNDDGAPPEEEEPSEVCRQCRGLGRDRSGAKCSACNGTGRVRAPVDDDDDTDDWPDEKESFKYEFQLEEE
jgi:hypothetical protein